MVDPCQAAPKPQLYEYQRFLKLPSCTDLPSSHAWLIELEDVLSDFNQSIASEKKPRTIQRHKSIESPQLRSISPPSSLPITIQRAAPRGHNPQKSPQSWSPKSLFFSPFTKASKSLSPETRPYQRLPSWPMAEREQVSPSQLPVPPSPEASSAASSPRVSSSSSCETLPKDKNQSLVNLLKDLHRVALQRAPADISSHLSPEVLAILNSAYEKA
ncbi:hypothetical protein ElyMa_000255900 [Elysia marginata]|uniref:Uncharacterized protein n=1 Tax=Elysia marginata TaxID=1093978 RepID=A0AAV4F2R1_9GAST|nr:hypothetical protein ElyMa_000255900 [Elysia marginata]